MSFEQRDFQKLRSWGWRNKGVRQKAGPLRALWANGGPMGVPGNHVLTSFDPGFPTGCWTFDNNEHKIVVGGGFIEHLTPAAQANKTHTKAAYRSLLRHECLHGLFSSRVEDVVTELRREMLPFSIFNVFEDAAIEHLGRVAPDDIDPGKRFRWKNWLNEDNLKGGSVGIDKPINWFSLLVLREASSYKSLTSGERGHTYIGPRTIQHSEARTRARIRWYYRQAVRRAETFDLIPLVKEWCREFGVDLPKGLHSSDTFGGHKDTSSSGSGATVQGASSSDVETGGKGRPEEGLASECFDPKVADLGCLEEADFDFFTWSLLTK